MATLLNSMLNSVRISSSRLAIFDIEKHKKCRFEGKSLYGFILILHGSCSIKGLSGTSLLHMEVGDYVFLFRDREIEILQDDEGQECHLLRSDPGEDAEAIPSIQLRVGSTGLSLLGGNLEFEPVIGPFLKLLPDWLVLNSQTRRRRFGKAQSTLLREALGRKGATIFLHRLVELYLVELIRNSTSEVRWMDRASMSARGLSNILSTVQLMATDLGQKWSVASLAKSANMSRSAFAMAFHDTIGKPPLQFLTELRMQRAASLLRQETSALKEISFEMGYESELAFSRAFRKFFGVTPSTFKKEIQEKVSKYSEYLDHWGDFVSN